VVATMFVAPARQTLPGSRNASPQVSGFLGATGQHYTISRTTRLEDGLFVPVSSPDPGFHPV